VILGRVIAKVLGRIPSEPGLPVLRDRYVSA
jgi:hypothetical protein